MQAQWIAERAALRCLARQHSDWTHEELADGLSSSRRWDKKRLARLLQAPPDDLTGLHARARRTPPPAMSPMLGERILPIRDARPEELQRVPGPRTMLQMSLSAKKSSPTN